MRFLGNISVAAAALAISTQTAASEYKLNIIHINDLHSRIESISRFNGSCDSESEAEGKCFGGVARVATKIDELRNSLSAAGENYIVLDAGDQFQGSLMYTTYKGAAEAEFMEKIGFDAMAVGNHEFDDGPQALAEFVDMVSFPVVSGNLDLDRSELLRGRIENHVVLEVGGEKIGIVSALATDTSETSSPGPNVGFDDEIASLTEDVAALEEAGVNKIIALTHVGLPVDIEIASAVQGIDAVVGGHSHTYLSSSDPDADGEYPTWVESAGGNRIPVVQAFAYSKYVGHLILEFDAEGALLRAEGDTLVLDASVEPNADIVARVAELAGPIEELKSLVVASAASKVEGDRSVCRVEECAMGNLVADAMLASVMEQGGEIAIQNGGGLRASFSEGEITMGDVLAVLPFQNTLATFDATGQTIVDALENGVSQVEGVKGRFPQVSGLKYTWDPSVAPNEGRIQEVLVLSNGEWAPINSNAVYRVVSNNYVRQGGDGYDMFATAENAYDYGPNLEEVVADYLAANSPYEPYTDGRIASR
ncbi:MAG: bifunctional metallophosphatase/5'-nucleotidase [Albidovulum sp.]|nr:bifunctional metallophosphatase/5'-nucleotidase [Albidovulum sp.]